MANTLQEKTLCQVVLGTVADVVYTCPPGTTTIIRYMRVCNNDVANGQFKLYLAPPGVTTLSLEHAITTYLSLNAQKMYSEPCFIALEEGWRIYGEANAADRLVVTLWGASID